MATAERTEATKWGSLLWGLVLLLGYAALALSLPAQPRPAQARPATPKQAAPSIQRLPVALDGGVTLAERGDDHANVKHSVSAVPFMEAQKREELEVWYSEQREAAMVVGCDTTTGMCCLVFVGMRNPGAVPGTWAAPTHLYAATFRWTQLDGRLELTHYWTPAARVPARIANDGYVRVYPPVPPELWPPVWVRITN